MRIKSDGVKAAREHLKETQEEFGARFGVTQGTVARWEINGLPKHYAFIRKHVLQFIDDLNKEIEKKAAKKKAKNKDREFA